MLRWLWFLLVPTPTLLLLASASAEPEAFDLGPQRLVLVPINLGVRPQAEVEPGLEPVWNEILAHFGGSGERRVTALERKSALALWNEVRHGLRGQRRNDVYAAYSEYARRISDQLDYGMIVFPSLVVQTADLMGTTAAWDGVRRPIDAPLVGQETIQAVMGPDLLVSKVGVRGEIAGASLHVAVLDGDGRLRFEGAGGLTLLHELVRGEVRDDARLEVALRPDAFSDPEELREGVEAAFREPLPASRAR